MRCLLILIHILLGINIVSGCPSAQTGAVTLDALNADIEEYIESKQYSLAGNLLLRLGSLRQISDKSDYLCVKKGKFQEIDSLLYIAQRISGEVSGYNSKEYAHALANRALLHIHIQHFGNVEEKLLLALDIMENNNDSLRYAKISLRLGSFYLLIEQPQSAYKYLKKSKDIYQNNLEENYSGYAKVMRELGNFHFLLEEYKLAEQCYYESVQVFQLIENKENDIDYRNCLLAQANLDVSLGRYEKAESVFNEVSEHIKQLYGTEHPDYINALSYSGYIHIINENYADAELNLREALQISDILFGKTHSLYYDTLNRLAILYHHLGFYETAESQHLKCLNLKRELLPRHSQSLLFTVHNLAGIYIDTYDYTKAKTLIDDALSDLNEETAAYAVLLSQKAYLYQHDGSYTEALNAYENVTQIYKKKFGEDHHMYIKSLMNIAHATELRDNAKKTEKERKKKQKNDISNIETLWLDILSRCEKTAKTNRIEYTDALNRLAVIYMKNQEIEKCQILLEKNINLLKDSIDETNLAYQYMLWNLAANKFMASMPFEAQAHWEYYLKTYKNKIQKYYTFLSEDEREKYFRSFRENLNEIYALSGMFINNGVFLAGFIYNSELLSKSLQLNSSYKLQHFIRNSRNENLIKDWRKLKSIKNKLMGEERMEDGLQIPQDSLKDMANTLEKNILASVKGYNETQKDFILEWRDIQKSLDKDEVAIELAAFINTEYNDTIYRAVILSPLKTDPELICFSCASDTRRTMQKHLHNFPFLYKWIWKHLEKKYLKDKKTVYITPTGLFHKMPFSHIHKGQYDIRYVMSTKDIPDIKNKIPYKSDSLKIVLFGGIDYDLSDEKQSDTEPDIYNRSVTSLTRGIMNESASTRGQGFLYLSETEKEVLAIDTILKGTGWTVDLHIGKDATKSCFKSYSSSSPDVLHISTHGFYYPKPVAKQGRSADNDNIYKRSDNPLLRSGLTFAGANNVWNKNKASDNIEDGILTAYEISNMDLSNTKLVVLSACRTGLGDVIDSEGIYGLQRAFRLAGVKSMIVSLWDIDDEATLKFMKEFYSLWNDFNRDHVRQAFVKAQNKLKNEYPESPEKWAGFVLIE